MKKNGALFENSLAIWDDTTISSARLLHSLFLGCCAISPSIRLGTFYEGLPGVLGNKGTLAKYRREQRNISRFLGTREQNSKNYSTKKF